MASLCCNSPIYSLLNIIGCWKIMQYKSFNCLEEEKKSRARHSTAWKRRKNLGHVIQLVGRAQINCDTSSNQLEEPKLIVARHPTSWKSRKIPGRIIQLVGRRKTNKSQLFKAILLQISKLKQHEKIHEKSATTH